MREETNKVSVVLRITGKAADLAELATALSSLQGQIETRPPNVPTRSLPEAWWGIEVKRTNQESTELAITDVLDKLDDMRATFQKVAKDPRFQIEVDCTVEIESERPVMEVSAQTLMRLATLHAALGFEVHDYRD